MRGTEKKDEKIGKIDEKKGHQTWQKGMKIVSNIESNKLTVKYKVNKLETQNEA